MDLEFCLLESSPEDPKEGDMKLCLDTLERSYDVFLLRSTQKNTMTVGARECINSIRETLRQCRDVLLFLIQDSM